MAGGRDRDRRRESYWRGAVGEQRGSGLTVREFCRRGKLRESAFHYWRRELERRDAEREQRRRPRRRTPESGRDQGGPTFVPVHLAEPSPPVAGGRIEIELSGGRRVHVPAPVDRQALADVLAVLSLPGDARNGEGRPC